MTVRARTASHSGVVPTTDVVQFVEPYTRLSEVFFTGATPATSGAATGELSAAASATRNVDAEPKPPRTPVVLVALPGDTISKLLPSALICELTFCCAPSPRPTVMTTPAMPMRMPSMVRAERRRCDRTASQPVRRVSSQPITDRRCPS